MITSTRAPCISARSPVALDRSVKSHLRHDAADAHPGSDLICKRLHAVGKRAALLQSWCTEEGARRRVRLSYAHARWPHACMTGCILEAVPGPRETHPSRTLPPNMPATPLTPPQPPTNHLPAATFCTTHSPGRQTCLPGPRRPLTSPPVAPPPAARPPAAPGPRGGLGGGGWGIG